MSLTVPNHGPNIIAAVWTCTPLAFLFLSLRLFCKFYKRTLPFWDDYLLIVSWCIFLSTSILVTLDVRDGFGKHTVDVIDEHGVEALVRIGLRDHIVGFLYLFAIAWSKTSFAVTLLHIVKGKLRAVIWAIIVSTNVLLMMAAFSFIFQCRPIEKLWDPMVPGTCWPDMNSVVSMLASAYSGFMDFVLALLPWTFIWKLNLRRKEKVGVAVAMSMGIFAGSTAIVKCYYLQNLYSIDFFYDGGNLAIWGAAELSTTIMASSIPVLRVLIRDVTSAASRNHRSMPHANSSLESEGSKATENNHSITAKAEHEPLPSFEGSRNNMF
ncbi:hypothetical protein F4821DRAFT_268795 [Hypoxylon rubiginosum]|uniref:Uncharacterized protein n=1 Tax=Hypoxylon rubiginosum TaxID=110542 RepID=A0ACC0D7I4_9PEZI|nr:hypothetical protein F4821DRAFT_268795 [Hypoxylon rubiginosum]